MKNRLTDRARNRSQSSSCFAFKPSGNILFKLNFTNSKQRRYNVGILSVLRRCYGRYARFLSSFVKNSGLVLRKADSSVRGVKESGLTRRAPMAFSPA
jgi:hypothetical protein